MRVGKSLRKRLREVSSMNRPKIEEDFEHEELVELCQQYLQEVIDGKSEDSDTPHYIFEAALTMVYGENVFEFINKLV